MRPIATDVTCSVVCSYLCLSACDFFQMHRCALQTAEPVENRDAVWGGTRVCPRNRVLDRVKVGRIHSQQKRMNDRDAVRWADSCRSKEPCTIRPLFKCFHRLFALLFRTCRPHPTDNHVRVGCVAKRRSVIGKLSPSYARPAGCS